MTRPRKNQLVAMLFAVVMFVLSPRLSDQALFSLWGVALGVMGLVLVAGRQLFRSRSLLRAKEYDAAAAALAAFEVEQAAGGWKAAIAFLFTGFYSADGVAVAREGLGVVRLEQGRLDDAAAHFRRALEKDPGYAMPWANLAVIAAMQKNDAQLEECREKAKALGFRRRGFEQVLTELRSR